MKITVLLAAILGMVGINAFAQSADIPHTISYQGKISSATVELPNGEHRFTVRLYSDEQGNKVVWKGDYTTAVENGIFNLQLGSGGKDLPTVNSSLWIGIQIDGTEELRPYTPITSAAYALNVANESITAEKMATDYVSAIRVNGKKIGGKASEINIINGTGVSFNYNEKQHALIVSGAPIIATPQAGAIQDVNKGGTGVGTIAEGGIMIGHGTNPISATTLTNGQLLVGATGSSPVAATLTGTANQVNVTSASGSITLSTPQSIGTSSSPSFSNLSLSGKGTSAATTAGDGSSTLTTKGYVDGAVSAATLNIVGTANQVIVASSGTTRTLSTPQNIGTSSSPTFAGLTLSAKATSAATISADGSSTLTTKGYVDDAIAAIPTSWSITGNAGTSAASNYIGSSDAADVVFSTDASERMRLTSDGALLLRGTSGAVPATGSGTRMMWIPANGAFRAGRANASEWNSGNVGTNSFAAGFGAQASGDYSVATGFFTSAMGISSTSGGSATGAVNDAATAFGSASTAVGISSTAIGDNATAWGDASTALGSSTNTYGYASMASGYNTTSNGDYSFASGKNLTLGTKSFGYNGSNTNSTVNVSAMSNVAYFGDVNVIIGNDDNSPRAIRFYESNSSATLSGANYTAIKAQNQSADITYTLPATQGSNGSVMSNNGAGVLSWKNPNVLSYSTVFAGETIEIPSGFGVVKIVDDGDNSVSNTVSMPGGTNGQMLYIFNGDAEATVGDATINAGAMATFIYVDGWQRAN